MPIRLNGSTSGFVELNAPAVAGTTTLELPTDSIKPGLVLVATATFSAASAVNVNSCFTSAYENYSMQMSCTTASGVAGIRARMRLSGTDNSSANYYYQIVQGRAAVTTSSESTGGTNLFIGAADPTGGWLSSTFFRPALAATTFYTGQFGYTMTTPYMVAVSGGHNVATAYDGITVYPDASTITGTLWIYGYRKA